MSNDELSLDDMRSALAKWLAGLDGRQQNKRNIAGLLEAAFQRIDALKTRVEVLDVAFANSHQLNESLGDENRALRARAEAAEAEAEDAILAASDAAQREENAMHALSHFRARVAELEAQLDAQGWRPVTEKPPEPPDGETSEYLTWNDLIGFTVRRYHDGQFHSAFRKQPTHWRPLPPAPQETTR